MALSMFTSTQHDFVIVLRSILYHDIWLNIAYVGRRVMFYQAWGIRSLEPSTLLGVIGTHGKIAIVRNFA